GGYRGTVSTKFYTLSLLDALPIFFPLDQSVVDGLQNDLVEDLLEDGRTVEPTASVLAECGGVRYFVRQRKSHKPAVCHVDPDLFHQAPFRANAVQIPDEQHFEQHHRVHAGTPIILAV